MPKVASSLRRHCSSTRDQAHLLVSREGSFPYFVDSLISIVDSRRDPFKASPLTKDGMVVFLALFFPC